MARILELLRRLVNYGEKKQLCEGINFIITMPKINNLKTEDLTPEQLQNLLDAIEEDTNVMAKNMMVYASMLASSGQVDMYALQKLLTHKSPVMTQRYAHLRDETLRKASNLAGVIISQAVNGNQQKVINIKDNRR